MSSQTSIMHFPKRGTPWGMYVEYIAYGTGIDIYLVTKICPSLEHNCPIFIFPKLRHDSYSQCLKHCHFCAHSNQNHYTLAKCINDLVLNSRLVPWGQMCNTGGISPTCYVSHLASFGSWGISVPHDPNTSQTSVVASNVSSSAKPAQPRKISYHMWNTAGGVI